MPAIPAVTLHSHVTTDADPLHLADETYLLIHRCRATVSSDRSERFVDLAGNCFLRVESDARMQFSIDYSVLEVNGLADYFPGRDLSDRVLSFANGGLPRHQFDDGGIFIYESASDDDPQGELRGGSCVISYDLHTNLDSTTYPATAASPVTYVDIPAQASPTEVSDTCKNLLLQDIFYGESNLDDTFTIDAYDGDPAAAGTLLVSVTLTDPWLTLTADTYWKNYLASPNDAIVFDSDPLERECSHLRLSRGSNVICDVELDTPLTIPADDTLRLPAANLQIRMTYPSEGLTGDDATENPARYFLPYILGGSRFTHFPEACFDFEIYESDPGGAPETLPVDSFRVETLSALWTVTGNTVAPATTIAGTNVAPTGDWDIVIVLVRLCNLPVYVIKMDVVTTVTAGNPWSSNSEPTLDLDA